MHGSHVVQNERLAEMNNNVRNFGKMLKRVAQFCVALFVFVLLNLVLDSITNHTKILSVNTFRLFEEGMRVFVNDNLFTFVSYVYQQTFNSLLFVACVCFGVAVVFAVAAFVQKRTESADNNCSHCYSRSTEQTVSLVNAISYRHKVCFLS